MEGQYFGNINKFTLGAADIDGIGHINQVYSPVIRADMPGIPGHNALA